MQKFLYISLLFSLLLLCNGIFLGPKSFASTTKSANCDRLAVGSFNLLKETNLSLNHRFMLSYDKEAMLKGDGINLNITNIANGIKIHFVAKAQLVFQGASDDLNQIFLQSAVGDHSEFYIYNKYGSQIQKFKLAWIDGEEEFLNGVSFDQNTKKWIIATNRRIVAYSSLQKNIETVIEISKKNGSAVEWFNQFDKSEPFVFANDGKNLLAFISSITEAGTASGNIFVFDSKTLKKVRAISISTQNSPLLLDPNHLVFPISDKNPIQIVDIISGLTTNMNTKINEESVEILTGPNDTFGILSKSGKIRYYNGSLQMVSENILPNYSRWAKVLVLGDGKHLLLLDSDHLTTYFYSLENREYTRLPQVLNFLARQKGISVFQNQIFAPIFNERTNKISLFHYFIQNQCDHELQDLPENTDLLNFLKSENMTALSILDNSTARKNLQNFIKLRYQLTFTDINEFKSLLNSFINNYFVLESVAALENSFNRIKNVLTAFQPFYTGYSIDEKESIVDSAAINLAEKFSKKSEYSEIPLTKIANIFVVNLNLIFGLPSQPKTDFVLVKDLAFDPSGKTVRPIIIGSQPINIPKISSPKNENKKSENQVGFYTNHDLPLQRLIENQPHNFVYDWEFNNQKWHAAGQFEILSLKQLINKEKSPRYDQYWADNSLVGMILISPNLGDPKWLVKQYLNYFKDQGFSFGSSKIVWSDSSNSIQEFYQKSYFFPKDEIKTSSAKSWLANLISEGVLDYFIKEAHSGGNDEVVFIGKMNSIFKGERKLANGNSETVFLVFPTAESFSKSNQVAITNQEFGSWIRTREASQNNNQLMYINASCWSSSKSRDEIIAARSPLLAEISTSYSSLTFKNSANNHLQVLLSSIRHGLPYADIQKNLKEVKTLDGTKNPYILPTQNEYDDLIWKGLDTALDYSVQVYQTK